MKIRIIQNKQQIVKNPKKIAKKKQNEVELQNVFEKQVQETQIINQKEKLDSKEAKKVNTKKNALATEQNKQ